MCAGRFDVGKLWNDALGGMDKGAPEVKQQMDMGVALIDAMLGFDISKDFMGAWGDKWTMFSATDVGGPGIFGFTLINQVADEAKLRTSMERLETLANQAAGEKPKPGGSASKVSPGQDAGDRCSLYQHFSGQSGVGDSGWKILFYADAAGDSRQRWRRWRARIPF